ncbi:MAG: D-2-hydroxyacid dehydrogenase [Synergistaceae bacterium]|jgi:phosphoglycerate dehydrogenase-like enzyme|nr:D-2-hydroxyacid dehydrogenase [Synergistaceae bacterium]
MDRLHIHFMRYRQEEPVYQPTLDQIKDALARNPDLAPRVTFTLESVERYMPVDWTDSDFKKYYDAMKNADVLYGYTFQTQNITDYAPQLKWFQSDSSGVEQLAPFDWVPEGLILTNSRGIHQPKSGESFAMYLGMLNSRIPSLFTSQRERTWNPIYTSVIRGKKIAVLGVGSQGGEMARQAKMLGLKVTGIDPYLKSHPCCDEIVSADRMKDVFRDTDFLALTAPLTKQTNKIIGDAQLEWLPLHASVINVARAGLLDTEALSKKLHEGRLAGAVLDVFDEHPLSEGSYLWNTPNLFISPHVSSDDPIHYSPRCLDILMTNVRNCFEGRPLINVVDTKKEF